MNPFNAMPLRTRRLRIRLMRTWAALLFGLSLAGAQADGGATIAMTSAEFKTPVVELYTSEGCSSCPSADNWLRQLGASLDKQFHAVPLAFHVDYWNYLGWNDPYSKPSFTERQRQVAANNRQRNIYTPEFLVDGREERGGPSVVQSIQSANSKKAEATIMVNIARLTADTIQARINVDNQSKRGAAHAFVAVYENGIAGQIGGGENRGKTLKHDFVVRHWSKPIAIRRGANAAGVDVEDVTIVIPADWSKPNLGLAVVLLDRASGETVQAVSASLAPLFSI